MAKPAAQPTGVEKLLYRRKEAAFALGCSIRNIDYMIAGQKLTTRKMGKNTLIPAADVRRLAQEIIRCDMPSLAPKRR